jgi:hypothetical protein
MLILSKPFDMKAGERIEVVVDLDPGVELAGRVIAAATEEPVEGAQVTLRRQPGRFGQASAGFVKTDAAGRFAFRYVPRLRYSLDFVAEGFEAAEIRLDLMREQAPSVVRLANSRRLVLRVDDAPAEAVGTEISWMFSTRRRAVTPQGKTTLSPNGELHLDAPPPGEYHLTLFRSTHLPRFERNVEIREGPLEPIVFRVRAGAVVVGTLRDATGKPVPDAVLRASSAKARTDADGRFRFARVPGGRHAFRLGVPDGYVALADVDVPSEGETEVDLALPGTGAIIGEAGLDARISLHAGDKPTNSALLQIKDPHKFARMSRGGRFRIPYLAPGTYVLVARVLNGGRLVRRVTVAEGETVDLGDLGVHAFPPVPLRVSVPAGARLPEAVRVTYRLPARDGLDEELWGGGAAVDAQGLASVRGPAPGMQEIVFDAEGFRSRKITIHVVEGMAPVVVELEPER